MNKRAMNEARLDLIGRLADVMTQAQLDIRDGRCDLSAEEVVADMLDEIDASGTHRLIYIKKVDAPPLTVEEVEASPATWTTRDGRVIPVRALTDVHLRNIGRYLLRWYEEVRHAAIGRGFSLLGAVRGEEAAASIEAQLDTLMDTELEVLVADHFPHIFDEIERRGIEL